MKNASSGGLLGDDPNCVTKEYCIVNWCRGAASWTDMVTSLVSNFSSFSIFAVVVRSVKVYWQESTNWFAFGTVNLKPLTVMLNGLISSVTRGISNGSGTVTPSLYAVSFVGSSSETIFNLITYPLSSLSTFAFAKSKKLRTVDPTAPLVFCLLYQKLFSSIGSPSRKLLVTFTSLRTPSSSRTTLSRINIA